MVDDMLFIVVSGTVALALWMGPPYLVRNLIVGWATQMDWLRWGIVTVLRLLTLAGFLWVIFSREW